MSKGTATNRDNRPSEEATSVLMHLVPALEETLAGKLLGIYLYGSLALGGFDRHSDLDVLVVPHEPVTDDLFPALQDMHTRIAQIDSWCATQLEVIYIHPTALRRYDPVDSRQPYLGRGPGERLQWVNFGPEWVVQRYLLRERGVTLLGPSPKSLVDPVGAEEMREAMRLLLDGRLAGFRRDASGIKTRGYQSYLVLAVCRVLRTLEYGDVLSKAEAAEWGKTALDSGWRPLIERAWLSRQSPDGPPDPNDLAQTQDLIGYARERTAQLSKASDSHLAERPGAQRTKVPTFFVGGG